MTPISPCVGVCRINPDTRLCEGCRRSLTEIAEWILYTEEEVRAIVAELPGRDPFATPESTTP